MEMPRRMEMASRLCAARRALSLSSGVGLRGARRPVGALALLVVEALTVDVDVGLAREGQRLTNDAAEVAEALKVDVGEAEQLVAVEGAVVEAAADHPLNLRPLELVHHARHVVALHPAAGDGYDGAEVEEVAQGLLRAHGGAPGLDRHDTGHSPQDA